MTFYRLLNPDEKVRLGDQVLSDPRFWVHGVPSWFDADKSTYKGDGDGFIGVKGTRIIARRPLDQFQDSQP